jgi:hypothetical protein
VSTSVGLDILQECLLWGRRKVPIIDTNFSTFHLMGHGGRGGNKVYERHYTYITN